MLHLRLTERPPGILSILIIVKLELRGNAHNRRVYAPIGHCIAKSEVLLPLISLIILESWFHRDRRRTPLRISQLCRCTIRRIRALEKVCIFLVLIGHAGAKRRRLVQVRKRVELALCEASHLHEVLSPFWIFAVPGCIDVELDGRRICHGIGLTEILCLRATSVDVNKESYATVPVHRDLVSHGSRYELKRKSVINLGPGFVHCTLEDLSVGDRIVVLPLIQKLWNLIRCVVDKSINLLIWIKFKSLLYRCVCLNRVLVK